MDNDEELFFNGIAHRLFDGYDGGQTPSTACADRLLQDTTQRSELALKSLPGSKRLPKTAPRRM